LCFAQAIEEVPVPSHVKVLLVLDGPPLPSLEDLGGLWLKGQYLTQQELYAKYGPSKEAVNKVEAFARKYKLDKKVMWRAVILTGSIEYIFNAFGIKLEIVPKGGKTCFCVPNLKEVPEELKDVVTAVLGLQGVWPRPQKSRSSMAREHKEIQQQKASPGKISGPPYTPPQLAALYNFPELDGAGECIGVLALAGQYKMENIEYYFEKIIGQPVPEIINKDINEPIEPKALSDSSEVMMDIEVAGSIAPKAKIVVYNSHSNSSTAADIYELFLTAILDEENNPSVLSFSFGFSERIVEMSGLLSKAIIEVFDDLFKFAALKGITICIASHDWGSSSVIELNGSPVVLPSVSFPAANPLVLACGGTRIKVENGKILEETVWNNLDYKITKVNKEGKAIGTMNGGASTGGVSIIFPLPGYQADVNVPLVQPGELNMETFEYKRGEPKKGRGVPDVSANADFINSPYLIYYDENKCKVGGGTSAATPLWAGLIARINQGLKHRVGFITPTLYKLQVQEKNVFRPITKGTNGCYIAYPNEIWNPCTGLGSPDGKKLLKALKRLKYD